MREGSIDRRTRETAISVRLDLDGQGRYDVETGIRFLDHMLELAARHGVMDLTLKAQGDLDVDQHHTVGGRRHRARRSVRQGARLAAGHQTGRGYFVMPMDETLAVAAVDFSGRTHAVVDLRLRARRVGDLQAELVTDFFEGFAQGARANVHLKLLYGRSSHHKVEAIFKAFARALRAACSRDPQLGEMLPSTKGLL